MAENGGKPASGSELTPGKFSAKSDITEYVFLIFNGFVDSIFYATSIQCLIKTTSKTTFRTPWYHGKSSFRPGLGPGKVSYKSDVSEYVFD